MKDKFLNFFKDKDGNWAIWQTPNAPLLLWGVIQMLARLINNHYWHFIMAGVAYGLILYWALTEVTEGSSYFRRALGIVVFLAVINNGIR